jgi:hypothetical protein
MYVRFIALCNDLSHKTTFASQKSRENDLSKVKSRENDLSIKYHNNIIKILVLRLCPNKLTISCVMYRIIMLTNNPIRMHSYQYTNLSSRFSSTTSQSICKSRRAESFRFDTIYCLLEHSISPKLEMFFVAHCFYK